MLNLKSLQQSIDRLLEKEDTSSIRKWFKKQDINKKITFKRKRKTGHLLSRKEKHELNIKFK